MCFITYNFINKAKLEMGSLGFRPKDNNELTLSALNENICDNLMRLKEINNFDVFYIFLHYQWIRKNLRKISRAMQTQKWNDVKYSNCEIKRSKYITNNIVIVTNIFSKKFHSIFLNDGMVKLEELKRQKSHEKKFDIIKFDNENIVYVFEKDYINSLKKKCLADKNKAIATVNYYLVDYKKGKCISYIVFADEIINSPEILKFAIKKIKSYIELANFKDFNLYNFLNS